VTQPEVPKDIEASDFGQRLRVAREERGFTQGAVATRAKMLDTEKKGISRTALVGYEAGTSKPGLREIVLLCEVLRVSPNWLIYGSESAPAASLPSMELLSRTPNKIDDVLTTALALTALKGHERDALQSLALSLAARQLKGDLELSSLLGTGWLFRDAFRAALASYDPALLEADDLNEVAAAIARGGMISNAGNRFRFDEEGNVLNPEDAVYPSEGSKKSEN
jgi:transcriptional regulator with XRE-family HTH domain